MKSIIRKLKSMPESLAMVTCASLLIGPLMILAAVIPSENTYPDDEILTTADLWRSWDGPLIVVSGIILIFFAVASLKRRLWVRYVWPIFFVLMIIHAFIARPDEMHFQWMSALVWLFMSYWYFFREKRVVAYFEKAPKE
jgi:cell division protein FtsW (lipid II flippase)